MQSAPCSWAFAENLLRKLEDDVFVGHCQPGPATLRLHVPLDRRRAQRRKNRLHRTGLLAIVELQRLGRPRQQAAVVAGGLKIGQQSNRLRHDLLQSHFLQNLNQVEHAACRRVTFSSTISETCRRRSTDAAKALPAFINSIEHIGQGAKRSGSPSRSAMARFRAGKAIASR